MQILGKLTLVPMRFITGRQKIQCDRQNQNMCDCNNSPTSHLDPLLLKRKSNLKRHLSYFLQSNPSFCW